jgi:peptidoglycan/LPS O-acetylase OafA/YrhL
VDLFHFFILPAARFVTYRSDIDGLRAFSVLAVVAFHLNGLIPGGYVGVDVFFVISGFLIGTIVFEEIDAGTFSFARFYQRRIRRIVPALVVTLIASYPASLALTGPSETVAFSRSSLAALFSVANIYFYATSGYFSANALDVPLLHLWSLGIEEQFYVFFPLIAVVLSKYFPRALIPVLVVLGFSSLLSSQIELSRHPEASFYLLQNRAFELTIGVLLARFKLKPTPIAAQLSAAGGAVLLVIAICFYHEKTQFPGLAALVPCLGSALVIWSGQVGTLLGRLLSTQPLVYLGKISYPLYLAHWPLIVFGNIAFSDAPQWAFSLFVVTGSILAAAATYHLIERPIRSGQFSVIKIAFLSSAACLSVGGAAAALLTSGFESRFDQESASVTRLESPDLKDLYLKGTCFLDPDQSSASFPLEKCFPDKRPVVLLWGDSHAAHLYNGLKFEFEKAGYSLGMMTASACPALVGRDVSDRPFGKHINDSVLSLINSRKPDIVILSAFWKPFVMAQLEQTLRLITQNHIPVVVLGNTPIFEESVPLYLARPLRKQIKVSDRSAAENGLRQLLVRNKIENVKYISLHDVACPDRRCLLTDPSGFSYYLDDGHLTKEGSRWIAKSIIFELLLNLPSG